MRLYFINDKPHERFRNKGADRVHFGKMAAMCGVVLHADCANEKSDGLRLIAAIY